MTRTGWMLLALCLCGAAAGDVVILSDGRRFEGQVTRTDGKVIVKTAYGTLEFDASEVAGVRMTPTEDAASRPATRPDAPTDDVAALLTTATRPESLAFLQMRNLSVAAAGAESFRLRQQIRRWQSMAHDRRRRAGRRWLGPEDYAGGRRRFTELREKAVRMLRQARPLPGCQRTREQRRQHAEALRLLRSAAEAWADPLLGDFLVAAADLEAERFRRAQVGFQRCCRAAPRVAMFHQGLGEALAALDRPLEGLLEHLAAARLARDEPEAFWQLQAAMQEVPGKYIHTPAFKEAKAFLDRWTVRRQPSYASKRRTWLTPGRPQRAFGGPLPTLAMDRLAFRQAVGVPAGEAALLVDAAAVRGAEEVFVRIGPDALVPAGTRSTVVTAAAAARELTAVTVYGVEFTAPVVPVRRSVIGTGGEQEPNFEAGQAVVALGLNAFEEMGSEIRRIPGKITAVDPNGRVSVSPRLVAGEGSGPVLTAAGRLVGFLTGRLDVSAMDGGPSRLLGRAALKSLLFQAAHLRAWAPAGVERTGGPQKVDGSHFVVYATFGERLEP
jgi:hypothetical protein